MDFDNPIGKATSDKQMSGAEKRPKRIMLVVGEASGDLHGAHLVKALHQRDPKIEVFGVAGEALRKEKIKVLFDVARLSGMGLTELVGSLGTIWQAYRLLRRALKEERPALLILIDFPEFNLRLACLAKQLGIPVLYYISPQIWAWRRRRIRKIAQRVDRIAVIFPFEVPLYESQGVRVSFVGHPSLEVTHASESKEATLIRYGLEPSKSTVALLPGSRRKEVHYHLPCMLEAAEKLARWMGVQFILVRATTIERRVFEEALAQTSIRIPIVEGNTYDALNACDLAWTASGTATLETALMLKPMIVVYRVSWITYALARLLVRVDHIGIVNIIAGETIVPELIQGEVTADRIVRESQAILQDSDLRQRMVEKLSSIRQKLGSPGAAGRVADMALSMIT